MNNRFKFRVWDIGRENYIDNPNLNWFNGYLGGEIGCCIVLNDILHKISTDGRFILEQCTGLKDKNGNLIYEGDIVKCDRDFNPDGRIGLIRKVVFDDGAFKLSNDNDSYFISGFHNIEIIGNIHEQKD